MTEAELNEYKQYGLRGRSMTAAEFNEYRHGLMGSSEEPLNAGWSISASFDSDSGKWNVKVYALGDREIDSFDVDTEVIDSLDVDPDAAEETPVVLDPFKGTRFILDEDSVLA